MRSEQIESLIKNVNSTMAMEDMPLTQEDKNRISDCLRGKSSFNQTVNELVRKYQKMYA